MRLRLAAALTLAASLCSAQQQPPDDDRDISWKKLVPNIVEDQKSIWLFPRRLGERRNLVPAAAFVVTGAALAVGADPPVARYFRNATAFNGFNRAMPGTATSNKPVPHFRRQLSDDELIKQAERRPTKFYQDVHGRAVRGEQSAAPVIIGILSSVPG